MNEKISVTSLASSSSGNAYHLKYGSTELLIDAGISARCICTRLEEIGTNIANVSAIFITHEHSDHVKGLEVLAKKTCASIHIAEPSAREYLLFHPSVKTAVIHPVDHICKVGDITVRSFFSSHDSCACVGYTFETESDKLGIVTDTGYVDKAALSACLGCSAVILESNYDEKMLESGPYPDHLKSRIRSSKGHLSNYDCAAFARFLAENGTKNFMLGHLSPENNTPELAFNVTSRALMGFDGIKLVVAAKNDVTVLI